MSCETKTPITRSAVMAGLTCPSLRQTNMQRIKPVSLIGKDQNFLRSEFRAFLFSTLVRYAIPDVGWFGENQGVLAYAIRKWIGPDSVTLHQIGEGNDLQHIFARVGRFYFDGDGPISPEQMRRNWGNLGETSKMTDYQPPKDKMFELHSDRLAALLTARFRPREVRSILGIK